ncbi:MAG: Spermidine/putrescine import ATP-binding protein PotA [Candidatus Celerinatantimonas neptuna]|nr:MAG: Spermidine/putrescine import ATP-binding protein PotA [Candidatus Celerinatantimonas neptuna]
MSAVNIVDVKVCFGSFEALRGISLNIESGEFITLLGPSGCGKTTLLKAIAGFIPLTSGQIHIAHQDVTGLPPEKRDTAMCFQSYALFPHLSVAENILFGPRQKGQNRKEMAPLLDQTARQLALSEQLDKHPGNLSGGQQQRVALARALAIRPGIVLFDEPLSNLDAKLRDSVRFEIRQLQRQYGFTAIYVTHDQSEALAMSDKVVVLSGGTIQQIGTPSEIYHQPINRFVADFVGTANILSARLLGRVEPNRYRIKTPIGELLIESQSEPKSDQIDICWRPESARFGQEDCNNIPVRVRQWTFLGNLTDVFVSSDAAPDAVIRVQLLGEHSFTQDQALSMHIPVSQLKLLQGAA